MTERSESSARLFTEIAVPTALAVTVVGAGVTYALYTLFPEWSARGQTGDMVAPVSALLAALGLAGVAIVVQGYQLARQRAEIDAIRQRQARTTALQERTESAIANQLRLLALGTQLLSAVAQSFKQRSDLVAFEAEKRRFYASADRIRGRIEDIRHELSQQARPRES